jgi:hypothetical protein
MRHNCAYALKLRVDALHAPWCEGLPNGTTVTQEPLTSPTTAGQNAGKQTPGYQWRPDLFQPSVAHLAAIEQRPAWRQGRRWVLAVDEKYVDVDTPTTTQTSRCLDCSDWEAQHSTTLVCMPRLGHRRCQRSSGTPGGRTVGHRADGRYFSGLVDNGSPDRGLAQGDHPLARDGFGEAVTLAFGGDQVGVVQ